MFASTIGARASDAVVMVGGAEVSFSPWRPGIGRRRTRWERVVGRC
ncbi:hypothetical protein [Nakamurella sp.]